MRGRRRHRKKRFQQERATWVTPGIYVHYIDQPKYVSTIMFIHVRGHDPEGSARRRYQVRRAQRTTSSPEPFARLLPPADTNTPILVSAVDELHRVFGRPDKTSLDALLLETPAKTMERLAELEQDLEHAKRAVTEAFRIPPGDDDVR